MPGLLTRLRWLTTKQNLAKFEECARYSAFVYYCYYFGLHYSKLCNTIHLVPPVKAANFAIIFGVSSTVAWAIAGIEDLPGNLEFHANWIAASAAAAAIGFQQDVRPSILLPPIPKIVLQSGIRPLNLPSITSPPAPETFRIFFDAGQSAITPLAMEIIAEVASEGRGNGPVLIKVAGFTDASGTKSGNRSLSERRASLVAAQLAADGVPQSDIMTEAFGQSHPSAPNGPGGHALANRRVEIILQEH